MRIDSTATRTQSYWPRSVWRGVLAATWAVACQAPRPAPNDTGSARRAAGGTIQQPPSVSNAHPALTRLNEFIRSSLEVGGGPDPDTDNPCAPDGQNDYSLIVAAYRVLGATQQSADTVVARAVLRSVATETDSATGGRRWHVVVAPRVDTLSWHVVRDQRASRWHVCGYALDGTGLGAWGGDSDTRFTPSSMSYRAIHALADSVGRNPGPGFVSAVAGR